MKKQKEPKIFPDLPKIYMQAPIVEIPPFEIDEKAQLQLELVSRSARIYSGGLDGGQLTEGD